MLKLMTCTCGNKMVRGQLVRPHEKSCECSWAPIRPIKKYGDGPLATDKQLAFLRRLRIDPAPGLTMKAAESQIKKVLKRKARR